VTQFGWWGAPLLLPFLLVKHAVPEGLARVKPVAALPALLQITAHDPEQRLSVPAPPGSA